MAKKPSTKKQPAYSFRIYPDNAGGYKWQLVTAGAIIMADSLRSYPTSQGARAAVRELVKITAGEVPVLRSDE